MIFSKNDVAGIISGITIQAIPCQIQDLKKRNEKKGETLFTIFI